MSDELTAEELRRKAVAAKSLLSRYENQRYWGARKTGVTITQINELQDRVNRQREVFQQAVRAFKQSQSQEQSQ